LELRRGGRLGGVDDSDWNSVVVVDEVEWVVDEVEWVIQIGTASRW